ncbi:sensor histidine kinase [Maribacter sp. MJ134]|jgi:two-component sensor histidine kinase|uniref:sensor histidine kinase n=1 Tax=Maribacter sp. MJ134 TaxID=2496865 RepID=UPI000F8337DA|nr:sensor histidine kinase [Maribacter sp. MJ134]AZQ58689.1 sensor histidine kinase [Maribacter sp. MJ134]
MNDFNIDQERLKDKINLILKVNYVSSALAIVFGFACFFILDIKEIIPYVFVIFGLLNLANTLFFRKHQSLTSTYNISSILALLSAFIITIYSGGINSSFIFTLALIVFAGYVTTRQYGQIYLNLIFFLVILIFSQSIPDFSFTENVIPEKSRNLFNLFSILFSVYLLGNIFGKNLLRTHHALYKSKQQLMEQMEEKETLLKEVHHRVKNNLQTVSSLLSLQSRNVEEARMKTLLKSTQNRVISMAMVHEMLYMRKDIAHIEYKSYVQELSEYLIRSIKGLDSKVHLKIDIPDIKLGIDTAIPLGLLINEAVTNALKYGFSDEEEGEIYIALKKELNKQYVLNIGDNGVGFPETVNYKNSKSLGLKLIHNLTRQLKGTIQRDSSKKGTNYIIKFQEVKQQLAPAM